METKNISIDITPDSLVTEQTENAGVMWEHNATTLVFNIADNYIGDYRYYLEYRSLLGTKVRTEYLTLDTETNTVTYNIPVTMSSLKGVECYFNIVSIDGDGNTVQVIKPHKFCLQFDYSPDTDNSLAKVNDFSVNALLEAIRLGTFKGDKGDKGETGEKGEKGDKGDVGDVSIEYANTQFANAVKNTAKGNPVIIEDASSAEHIVDIKVKGKNLFNISKVVNGSAGTLTNNSDGTLTVRGTGVSGVSPNTLKDYAPSLEIGKRYILSADTTSTKAYIYLKGDAKASWFFGKSRIITEADLNAPVGWYSDSTETSATISNIQIEEGSVATEYVPYVEPSTVDVVICGKNLIPYPYVKDSLESNGITFTVQSDGGILINGTSGDSLTNFHLIEADTQYLPKGKYRLSLKNGIADQVYLVSGNYANEDGISGENSIDRLIEATQRFNLGYCCIQIAKNITVDNLLVYPQLECGEISTEYEQYKGSVYNLSDDKSPVSVYPVMTVMSSVDGVEIECEYNQDTANAINKVAESFEYRLINSVTLENDAQTVYCDRDSDGNAIKDLQLKKIFLLFVGSFLNTNSVQGLVAKFNSDDIYQMEHNFNVVADTCYGFWLESRKMFSLPDRTIYKSEFPLLMLGGFAADTGYAQGNADNNISMCSDLSVTATAELKNMTFGCADSGNLMKSGSTIYLFGM